MMERESSDEEKDRENLISQNARPNEVVKSPNHRLRSAFRIEDEFRGRFLGSARRFNKRYLFAIILPMVILILYYTTDLKSFFQMRLPMIKDIGGNSPSINRMRESELRALYLLKQQELELFKMWNSTTLVSKLNFSSLNNSSGNNNGMDLLSSPMLEDLKSRVFSQISLNKQIQGVLLSSHESGGSLDLTENYTDASFSGWTRCRKVDQRLSERRTIEWNPRSNKYLFAICVSGQMSNHLICLEKHMFFAALLNRILVIPSSKVDYEFHRVLDIEHINKCLGRKVVVTFEEFAESKKNHLRINKFMCYFSLPQPCYMDDERVKKLKGLGLSLSKVEAVWKEDVKKPTHRKVEDVLAKFSSDDDVIAIGDVFFAGMEREWVMQPGGPIAHKCKTLIEPSRLILLTAQRFIQTFLGKDFIALHFRRHGFLKFCNAKQPSCFYPVPQAADCINRVVESASTPVIYLSTDAAESETGLLQSLVVWNGKTVPLVRRPARNSAEKWDALLYRHGLEEDSQMNVAWSKLENAPQGTFKNKIHGLGLKLLSRVKPSEIFFKSIPKEINEVDIVYPSSLNPRLVRRRLRHIAFRGSVIHKKYFYGSAIMLPLTSVFMVLPLPNIPFFWILFRAYSHWRASQGSEKLLHLVSDASFRQQESVDMTEVEEISAHSLDKGSDSSTSPPWVFEASEELQKLLQQYKDGEDGVSNCAISKICQKFYLNPTDVVKYRDSV